MGLKTMGISEQSPWLVLCALILSGLVLLLVRRPSSTIPVGEPCGHLRSLD